MSTEQTPTPLHLDMKPIFPDTIPGSEITLLDRLEDLEDTISGLLYTSLDCLNVNHELRAEINTRALASTLSLCPYLVAEIKAIALAFYEASREARGEETK